MSAWAPLAVMVVLAGLAFRRPGGGGAILPYVRSLVPSWRFFDQTSVVPVLEARRAEDPNARWEEVLGPVARGLGTLLFNGPHNLRLAEHGVLEVLLEELDGCERDRAPELASYRMACTMVARHFGPGVRYQYRLLATGDGAPEEVFRSAVHAS